ncbi:hypothetical protein ACET3Z_000061 [Daucus carota]
MTDTFEDTKFDRNIRMTLRNWDNYNKREYKGENPICLSTLACFHLAKGFSNLNILGYFEKEKYLAKQTFRS